MLLFDSLGRALLSKSFLFFALAALVSLQNSHECRRAHKHTHTRTQASRVPPLLLKVLLCLHTHTHILVCVCVEGKKSCVSHAQNVFFILKSRVPLLQMATTHTAASSFACLLALANRDGGGAYCHLPALLPCCFAALKMPTVCHHLGSFLTYKHLSRGGLSRPGLG